MHLSFLEQDLQQLQDSGLRRSLREVSSAQSKLITLNGQQVLNFCSNNYLGLADDPRIKQAAIDAIRKEGFGSGASRLVCGNMSAHQELEEDLAAFKKTESCLLFSSGYMANVGVISALVGRDGIVFCDKLNHASIIDGIVLSRAELKRYPHADLQTLEESLKNAQGFKQKLIVTDTVFSMDGDVAPLKEIVALAKKYEAMVMVDEAHGFGVLGPTGAGLVEELGLEGQVDVQMGTLSKAAGCFGAYVCGSKVLKEYLINHARSFIYTTALPPAMARAASAALAIIQEEPQRRKQLLENVRYLRQGLREIEIRGHVPNFTKDSESEFGTCPQTPIIPVIVKDAQKAVDLSARMLEQGIFAQAIRPPTVPVNTARLRVTVMATHAREDLDKFLSVLKMAYGYIYIT